MCAHAAAVIAELVSVLLCTCRVQVAGVGTLEKLTVGLSTELVDARSWMLEQVEVMDETTGGALTLSACQFT